MHVQFLIKLAAASPKLDFFVEMRIASYGAGLPAGPPMWPK